MYEEKKKRVHRCCCRRQSTCRVGALNGIAAAVSASQRVRYNCACSEHIICEPSHWIHGAAAHIKWNKYIYINTHTDRSTAATTVRLRNVISSIRWLPTSDDNITTYLSCSHPTHQPFGSCVMAPPMPWPLHTTSNVSIIIIIMIATDSSSCAYSFVYMAFDTGRL